MKSFTRSGITLILAFLACLYAPLAAAQVKIQPSNFDGDRVVQPTNEIRLKLDRLPTSEEGKLAIFIDRTDVTSQFRLISTELIYQPSLFPLPPGEVKVTVYLVKGSEWQEIAQFPLKVASQTQSKPVQTESKPSSESADRPPPTTPKPIEKLPDPSPSIEPQPSTSATDLSNSLKPQLPQKQSTQLEPIRVKPEVPAADFTSSFKPRMNITVKSQFLEQRSGDTEAAERPTFTDTTVESGFESEITSGTFNLQSQFSLLGVTFQPEALRFGELGEAAPRFDLSEYQINAKWGPVQFSMGHLCYGNHPFLFSNVCSREMTLKANFTDRVDLSINSMNATSIVGFDNFTGLNDFNNNNISAATLGFQLIKNEFGGIRLEATLMEGDRKPVGDFNEGQVIDAEKSRGFGLRLFGSDNSGRLRLDVGYARSTFTNPPDPQLTDAGDGADARLADEFEADPVAEEPVQDPDPVQDSNNQTPTEPVEESPAEPPISEAPIVEEPVVEEPVVEGPVVAEPTNDTTEAQELKIVPVKPVTKSAFYAEFSYDLLKDVKLGSDRTLSSNLAQIFQFLIYLDLMPQKFPTKLTSSIKQACSGPLTS